MSGWNLPPGVTTADVDRAAGLDDEPCSHGRAPEDCDKCYIASLEDEVDTLEHLVRDTLTKLRAIRPEHIITTRSQLVVIIRQLRNRRVG